MNLFDKTPWRERPGFDFDLSQPLSVQVSAFSPEALRNGKALIRAMPSVLPPGSEGWVNGVRERTRDRFHPEATALADRIGVHWREILLGNVAYDILIGSMGCSTVVLPTPAGPVMARNMDFVPEVQLAQASYMLRHHGGGKLAFTNAAFPGTIGVVTGLSARGFAIVLNAVSSPEGVNITGYPVLLFLRTVLEEAQNFDDALKRISEQPLCMAALVTLVGNENHQRVVIERSPTRHALRWGEPGKALMTTNHYRLLYPIGDDNPDTCSRFARLCQLLGHYDERNAPDDTALLRMLSDESVIQEITAQHIIMRPRQQEAKLFVPSRLVT